MAEEGAQMERSLRILCVSLLVPASFFSAVMAADTECPIISNEPALVETVTGSKKGDACNGKDAADEVGRARQTGCDTEPESVLDKTWQWETTITISEKTLVPDPERYTIRLTKEGRLQARFDCNRGGGDYTLSAGRLTFGPMLSTRMACPPDSLDMPFMRDLQKVASFFVQDGKLFLEFKEKSGTMRFRSGL